MRRNSIILLIIGTLLSGCVSNGVDISGTYTQNKDEFTFYEDGTFYYTSPGDSNSGVFTIHDKDLVITGQLQTATFKILENGSLRDPENGIWTKKPE